MQAPHLFKVQYCKLPPRPYCLVGTCRGSSREPTPLWHSLWAECSPWSWKQGLSSLLAPRLPAFLVKVGGSVENADFSACQADLGSLQISQSGMLPACAAAAELNQTGELCESQQTHPSRFCLLAAAAASLHTLAFLFMARLCSSLSHVGAASLHSQPFNFYGKAAYLPPS